MRTIRHYTRFLLAILCMTPLIAYAQSDVTAKDKKPTVNPAIIYLYSGDEGDSAFINSAKSGIALAERDFGVTVSVTRMKADENVQDVIRKVALTKASPVILLGNQNVAPLMEIVHLFPGNNFAIIDGLAPPLYPNVQSILFKDHEGAFLVGIIAGRMSHSGSVGFVGGMDIPLIRNFAKGYTQGVKYAAPDTKVSVQMVGSTADAWSNPEKARTIAHTLYHEGADIIFAAAGGSSVGVLQAASEMHQLAIGVDSNQNGIFPGSVLTSLVKRVDVAVYDTIKQSQNNTWRAGVKYLGIKEGALDYAVDQNNRGLMSEELIEEVATAKDKIISGKITVESYSAK